MKVDAHNNLLYIKGAIPGSDAAYVKIRDSVRKGWFGKTFPADAQVPFPTFLGDPKEGPREFVVQGDESVRDPFSRPRREKE